MTAEDLVIADLAAMLATAEANVAKYRQLAVAGIERVRELTIALNKLGAQIEAQREEIRTLVTAEREMAAARSRRAS